MRIRSLLLACLLAAAPAPVLAQHSPRAPHAQEMAGRGPVEVLLRRRAELALTADQVARLEAIDKRMEERNRPLVSQLVEMRRRMHDRFREPPRELTPEQRAEFRRHLEEARPLLDRIRANNHAAMEEVGTVLTAEQKARLREMLRERRRDGRDGKDRDERRPGRSRGGGV